jgi:AbrB family looped-hinge helix DNA binding protein
MTGPERYMATVKVGMKGQIVIPREVRTMFEIVPGDLLILLADVNSGIAIHNSDPFIRMAEAVFSGRASEVAPDEPLENVQKFANEIKKAVNHPLESEEE